jgi:hypothetical protein
MVSTDQDSSAMKQDPSQDPSSPYYLHPADNPATVTITPVLNGARNYQIWSRHMARGLSCKDKLGFVTNSVPKPLRSDPLHHAWTKCNNMVISWLTRSVSPSIVNSIAYFDKAYDIWKDLRDRFSKGDAFRFSDLQ